MTLWGARFDRKLDAGAWELNASIRVDQRLAGQDIRGSMAWARAIKKAGVLTEEECEQICQGLRAIQEEFSNNSFVFHEEDEDIHTAVERRLGELIGSLAGKLHTGRSRNDQVATDSRLWLMDHLPGLDDALADLQSSLLWRAESDMQVLLPGYTHLQRAQPILLSHWWLSHFWPIWRDRQRLTELKARTACMPLGSAALAGTSLPVDRNALASDLGFTSPSPNSIDAVSDRDFIAEFLFCCALIGVHLSRLADAVVLFSSAEFGFFKLSDAFSTGSSLMPQKKNPDVFELARGKSGSLIGYLTALLVTLKGLPSAYDKDLQEDKTPMFAAYDALAKLLPVLTGALLSITIVPERMRSSIDPTLMATDLADELVRKGVPFREAHSLVGQAVRFAERTGRTIDALTPEELGAIDPLIDLDMSAILDPWASIKRHACLGGSAPEAVKAQLEQARQALAQSLQDNTQDKIIISKEDHSNQ